MTTAAKPPIARAKKRPTASHSTPTRSQDRKATSATQRSSTDDAIATHLAPAVAIALLDQSEPTESGRSAALEPIAAGAVASNNDDKLRVQLLFVDGAVLPVELSVQAAAALAKGITKELPKAKG